MLTPKGMIVVDAWVVRHGAALTLVAPARGPGGGRDIFQRGLPPRLAKADDVTDGSAVAWMLGDHGFHTLVQSGIGAPDTAGRVVEHEAGSLLVALAPEGAPFVALLAGPGAGSRDARPAGSSSRARSAATRGIFTPRGSWPAGRRSAPRSTRRPCPRKSATTRSAGYRTPRAATPGRRRWPGSTFAVTPIASSAASRGASRARRTGGRSSLAGQGGRHRALDLTVDGRTLGLAIVRREVEPGSEVVAGGRGATVVTLPFGGDELDD